MFVLTRKGFRNWLGMKRTGAWGGGGGGEIKPKCDLVRDFGQAETGLVVKGGWGGGV